MSQLTKKAIAASLKSLLEKRSFDKITVKDIVEDCGVNRQTFYYHFQDIYELIEWIFTDETEKALNGKKTYDTWQQGFLQIFERILANKRLAENVYDTINREYLERYLYKVTFDLLIGVIEEQADNQKVKEEDKKFIADFYKFAFVGLILDWIHKGMKEEPQKIVEQIDILINGDIQKALRKYISNEKH